MSLYDIDPSFFLIGSIAFIFGRKNMKTFFQEFWERFTNNCKRAMKGLE
jgi:hypothetical protein